MEISSLGLGVLIGGALVFAALRAKRVEEQGGGGALPSAPSVHALMKARTLFRHGRVKVKTAAVGTSKFASYDRMGKWRVTGRWRR